MKAQTKRIWAIRLTEEERKKLNRLGGADWLREIIAASVVNGKLTRMEKIRLGLRISAEAMTRQRDQAIDALREAEAKLEGKP